MRGLRTPLDAELLEALKGILERLNRLQMSEPDDKATSDLQRGIRKKITEIESNNEDSSAA